MPDKQWCRALLAVPFIHVDSVSWLAEVVRNRFALVDGVEISVDVHKHKVLQLWQADDGSINAKIESEPSIVATLARRLPKDVHKLIEKRKKGVDLATAIEQTFGEEAGASGSGVGGRAADAGPAADAG
eukprot:5575458-Pyramimonas_sp.AAC.1